MGPQKKRGRNHFARRKESSHAVTDRTQAGLDDGNMAIRGNRIVRVDRDQAQSLRRCGGMSLLLDISLFVWDSSSSAYSQGRVTSL